MAEPYNREKGFTRMNREGRGGRNRAPLQGKLGEMGAADWSKMVTKSVVDWLKLD